MNIEKIKTIVRDDFREAVFNGDYDRVSLLLNAGMNPNKFSESDPEGDWTPIMYAACGMHFKITEALLKAGANLDVILIDGDLKQNLFEIIESNIDRDGKIPDRPSAEIAEAMKTLITRWAIKRNIERNNCSQTTYK